MARSRKPRVSHKAGYGHKNVRLLATIRREVSARNGRARFVSCVSLPKPWASGAVRPHGGWASYACRPGRNPRVALANAMRASASLVAGRSGTFAGVR